MYPHGELVELEQRKAILRARISVRRWECAIAAAELARPISYLDRAVEMWHRVSPFVKVLAIPGGLLLSRMLRRRRASTKMRKKGKIAALIAALPLIIRGVKMALQIRAGFVAKKSARAKASGTSGGAPA